MTNRLDSSYVKEIQHGNRKSLKSLFIENKTLTKSSDITAAARDFYKSLYSHEDIDTYLAEKFLVALPKLSDEEQKMCEGKLNFDECFAAIKQMKNKKCPGSDELPKEFYVKFFPLFGKSFVSMINLCFTSGKLTKSQRHGIISLLCKKPEASQFLTNWCPISLLNVDYKIISKVMW